MYILCGVMQSMPKAEGDSTESSRRVEREEYWQEVEVEREAWADMDPFETEDDTVEDTYFDMEQELHFKADRRKTKKETMPMDGRGLVVNNVNRKFRQVRRNEKES